MKCLIFACLLALAAAQMADQCKKPEMSQRVQKMIQDENFNPKDLCFDVQAHISAAKHVHGLMKDCDPVQKKIFMHMMMKKFYEFCIKGEHDECFMGVARKAAFCSMKQGICPHDFLKTVKNSDECSSQLTEMEKCFESGETPKCDKVIVDFYEGMKEHLEDMDDEAPRHDVMCELMTNM